MRHVEFFDRAHFQDNYFRQQPPGKLSEFIDFFWETNFDHLFESHPAGFSDALFPNTGYSYLINIGTPYVMLLGDRKFAIRGDSFLPRHQRIECFHRYGNRIFGIKFRISPVLLEKKINFSEYRKAMSPLSYLINKDVADEVKEARTFLQRVERLTIYFSDIISKSGAAETPAETVSAILRDCYRYNDFNRSIEELAARSGVSSRTLQRYFESATSLSSKKTLQLMRIRKALEEMMNDGAEWHYSVYGYYDYSHFHRHLVQFAGQDDAARLLLLRTK